MIEPQGLIDDFQTTHWIIKKQTAGLSHEDSLHQLPFRGNCMNWVLGHILVGRNRALKHLGQNPTLTASEFDRYKTGSPPVIDGHDALPIERLLADLDLAQERIEQALKNATPEALEGIPEGKERSIGELLASLHWHETYHTGQLEFLRQLTGTNDKVI